MLQTADVCIVMSQDSFEVIRRPEDSCLMFSNRPRDKGWGKVYSSSIVSQGDTGGKWIYLMCTKVMFTCLLEVTLMRGICYSTTLHQRKIKFQIFTSENFVLAGRMCGECLHSPSLQQLTVCIVLEMKLCELKQQTMPRLIRLINICK